MIDSFFFILVRSVRCAHTDRMAGKLCMAKEHSLAIPFCTDMDCERLMSVLFHILTAAVPNSHEEATAEKTAP